MFNLDEIKELINLVDQSSIQELKLEKEGTKLKIKKSGQAEWLPAASAPQIHYLPAPGVPQSANPANMQQPVRGGEGTSTQAVDNVDSSLHTITSPMVGTFYSAPSPGAPSFVDKGDKVSPKSVVCIIEAMKLMNEIEAETSGEVVDILVENGQLVEFGQPLFRIRPE